MSRLLGGKTGYFKHSSGVQFCVLRHWGEKYSPKKVGSMLYWSPMECSVSGTPKHADRTQKTTILRRCGYLHSWCYNGAIEVVVWLMVVVA